MSGNQFSGLFGGGGNAGFGEDSDNDGVSEDDGQDSDGGSDQSTGGGTPGGIPGAPSGGGGDGGDAGGGGGGAGGDGDGGDDSPTFDPSPVDTDGDSGGGGGGESDSGGGTDTDRDRARGGIGGDDRGETGGDDVDTGGPQGPAQDGTNDQEQGPPEGPTSEDVAQGVGGMSETRGGDVPDAEQDAPDPTQAEQEAFSGRTAGAEAFDDSLGQQARELENELSGEQISQVVDGVRMSGAEFRDRDIVVEREGDQLVTELSEVGRQRLDAVVDRQQVEQIERELEREFGREFASGEDVRLEDGEVRVSDDVRAAAAAGERAGQDTQPTREPVTPAERDDNRPPATAAGQQADQQGDFFSAGVDQFEAATGTDVPGEGSLVNQGRQDRQQSATGEAFGGQGQVETALRGLSQGFQERVTTPAGNVAADVGALSPAAIAFRTARDPSTVGQTTDRVADIVRGAAADQTQGGTVAEFNRGTAEGGAGIVNLPALGVTGIEAGEVAAAGADAAAEGETGEFSDRAAAAGAATAADLGRAAASNPARFAGTIAGSAVVSSGTIRAGQALAGARGARAAAFGVQPGEELAIAAARRGVPGTTRLAGAIGDVSVDGSGRSFIRDESARLDLAGRRRGGDGGSSSDTDGGTSDTGETVTLGGEDLDVGQGRAADRLRGGRFGTEPRSGRTPDRTRDATSEGETGAGNVRGFRSAETERARGGRSPEEFDRPGQDLREQAEAREVTEAEARTDALEDTGIGLVRRTEAAARQQVAPAVDSRQQAAQRPELSVDDVLGARPRSEPTADVRGRVRTDVEPGILGRVETRTDARTEPRSEPRQETRLETRQETRQEGRQEGRQETRQEARAEFRFEARREAEGDDRGLPGGGQDDRQPTPFGTDAAEVVTAFRNPLTGRVLDDDG